MNLLRQAILFPGDLYDVAISRFVLPALLKLDRKIQLGRNVRFSGSPIFSLSNQARVELEDDVFVNSRAYSYHTLMPGRCLFRVQQSGVIRVGESTRLHGVSLTAYSEITIGKRCLIAAGTMIMDCGGHDICFPNVDERILATKPNGQPNIGAVRPVVIEDSVWIGAGAMIMPGVRIGYGSIVAAGSVVTKNIPPLSIYGGGSAKEIHRYVAPIDSEHD